MVADSRHRKKTFRIENKLSELRKKLWNPEKYFRVQKKRKKKKRNREKNFFRNWEKKFRIEKYLLQESRKNLEFNDFEFNEPPS